MKYRKRRVLLVQAPSVENASSERVYPIGIVLLATRLREAGHEVFVLDMNLQKDKDPYTALREKLLELRPDVAGFSLRNLDPLANRQASFMPQFAAAVRLSASVLPQAVIMAGGTGFSLFAKRIMSELPEIKFGITGEAEYSLPALVHSIENPPALENILIREGETIKKAGSVKTKTKKPDMSVYIPADKTILDPGAYLDLNSYTPAFGIEGKRGCPYNCSYCVYPALQGKKARLRAPLAIVDEMEQANKKWGIDRFHFTDPVVNSPSIHLEEVCREILRRKLKIKWNGFFRESLFDPKSASLYERAGCECISFSPDGLCNEALHALGKKMSEKDILKAARVSAETGMLTVYHFMVNAPGESEKTKGKAIALIERLYDLHSPKRNLGTIVLNNIRILPGTPVEAMARQKGIIREGTDLLYPAYYNPPPLETFRYELETLHFGLNVASWQGGGNLPE